MCSCEAVATQMRGGGTVAVAPVPSGCGGASLQFVPPGPRTVCTARAARAALTARAVVWYICTFRTHPPFFWVGGGEIRCSDLGRRGFTVRFRV